MYGSQSRRPRRPTGALTASDGETTAAGPAAPARDGWSIRPRSAQRGVEVGAGSSRQTLRQRLELDLGRTHRLFHGHVVDQRVLEVCDDDLPELLVVVDEVAQQRRRRERVDGLVARDPG